MGAPKLPVLAVVGALAVAACGGSDDPAGGAAKAWGTSTLGPPTTSSEPGVTPQGFDRVAAQVTAADGDLCELCVWLADTGDERRRGLMGVTDLGAAEAMAFLYPAPETSSFWMKDTLLPLSIAFYAADGTFLDSFDMEPCTADPCTSYPTPADFVVAVEVPRGGLDDLLMQPGSTVELLALPCE